MGYPMARNLARAGHTVAVWTNNDAKAARLASEETGIVACATPKEVATKADCVFVCVGNTKMVQDVLLGKDGLIEGGKTGSVVIDASTISPVASVAIGEALKAKGIDFIGAPCTGSKPGAEGGTLTFMIGGDKAVYEKVKPYMDAVGKQFYYCGGPGMGLHAKLTQNLILCNIMQAFSEGLVMSTKAGVDPELMLTILDNSAAKSGLINYKAPFVFNRDFTTNFSLKWMHKDMGLMLESAETLGVPVPITSLTRQMFQAAIGKGLGEEDFCSTIKLLEDVSGVVVKKS